MFSFMDIHLTVPVHSVITLPADLNCGGPFPICAEDILDETFPDTPTIPPVPSIDDAYMTRIMDMDLSTLRVFDRAYISTYEIKVPYEEAELSPSARDVLPDVTVARLYDALRMKGIKCFGLAPAHKRRGVYAHDVMHDDAPRHYAGPPRPPHQKASDFSALPDE